MWTTDDQRNHYHSPRTFRDLPTLLLPILHSYHIGRVPPPFPTAFHSDYLSCYYCPLPDWLPLQTPNASIPAGLVPFIPPSGSPLTLGAPGYRLRYYHYSHPTALLLGRVVDGPDELFYRATTPNAPGIVTVNFDISDYLPTIAFLLRVSDHSSTYRPPDIPVIPTILPPPTVRFAIPLPGSLPSATMPYAPLFL